MRRSADAAANGRGRMLFVLGEPGSGKQRLVGRLLELNDARERPMAILRARAGDTPNIWETTRRRVTRRRRIRRFLASTVPEWIAAIPVVGNVIAATIRTVQLLRSRDEPETDPAEEARRRAGTIAAVDEMIEEIGGPTILVIRQLEQASDHDLAGAFHSLRALGRKPILVVATVSLHRGRPPAPVLDLLREAERYDAGETIQLAPLAAEAWQRALAEATGTTPPPAWIRWFADRQPLTPAGLWALLGEVQATGGVTRQRSAWSWSDGPGTEDRAPRSSQDVEDRLRGLAPDDRRFLARATRSGPNFTSHDLHAAEASGELEIQDRLARLEREGWIRFVDTSGPDDDLVDAYEVALPGLVEALRQWSGSP